MNGKHTPGPWERHGRAVYTADKRKHWVEGRDARPVYIAQIRARHDAEIGERVGDIEDNPVEESEADANAALIAAAPDMLEALRELLADRYLSDPVNNDRMAKARAAVLKATGEEFGMPFTYPVSAPIWRDGKPVDPADVPLPVRKRIHWAARNGDAFIVYDGAEWQWD